MNIKLENLNSMIKINEVEDFYSRAKDAIKNLEDNIPTFIFFNSLKLMFNIKLFLIKSLLKRLYFKFENF